MLTLSALNIWNASRGSNSINSHAAEDLESKIQSQLAAVRDLKNAEIVDYFGTIRDQAISLSEDVMVVEAMVEFRNAFDQVVESRALGENELAEMRTELRQYYEDSFASEYQQQNEGRSANANNRLQQIDDSAIALQHAYIFSNSNPLGSKHLLDAADTATEYDRLHARYHPSIRGFLERFGYYDIFLADIDSGRIVYSVFKELDYATSLRNGPYAQTNFARAFRQAAENCGPGEVALVDFECYWPSYEAPASFIASPIFDGSDKVGVLLFQMPVDRINGLMARESGIGKTGETLLVGRDNLQRCNSSRDPETYSLIQAFRGETKNRIETESVKAALAGDSGVIRTQNYLGEEVLSAFSPISLLGLDWAIITEVTTEEAFAAISQMNEVTASTQANMFWFSAAAVCAATLAIIGVALLVTRSLLKPIDATVNTLRDIAEGEGDLTRRLDENQIGELGDLARNFNQFVIRIHDIVRAIAGNASTLTGASQALSDSAGQLSLGATQSKTKSSNVSSAAEYLSTNMQNMASSTQEISSSISAVANAVEEMKTTISEIAENAEQSAGIASQAASAAEISNAKVGDMGSAASEIGKVIEVIQDIAEQTNLLALNATIEAARAGEAGKGFAVVATEVKELAKQTASATDDIRRRIEVMQDSTDQAVESIEQIGEVIGRVNELSRMIASAVEEQNITTQQIAEHIGSTAGLAEKVAASVSESAASSREITENINQVDRVLQDTATGANRSKESGDELLRLATEMHSLVDQFRVEGSNTMQPAK